MRTALIFILILGLCLVKRDNHSCFISSQNSVRNGLASRYPLKNITNPNHKRSAVDLFVVTACCEDDNDVEHVKRKTGPAVTLFTNDQFATETGKSQRTIHAVCDNSITSANYIFNRELLI